MKNGFNVLRRLTRSVTVPLAAVCLGARADFTNEFVVADGSFHDAANWSSNAVPDSTMRAHVSGDRTARISSDVTVNRFGVGVVAATCALPPATMGAQTSTRRRRST